MTSNQDFLILLVVFLFVSTLSIAAQVAALKRRARGVANSQRTRGERRLLTLAFLALAGYVVLFVVISMHH
jgi:threonine/homoserine/homoserine lactone efflux protein